MPRKAWLVPLLLAAALVIQLTLLNGLRLPGGGVPDLALVLVAAFAMADGPIYGMALGFGTGLSLDLAPPASQYIGQYALVFLLAGWAAGRLSTAASKSAPRAAALVAVVVTAAEALAAGLGLVLEPDQVSLAQVRVVLPATIVYNLLLCPFVLYLVMLVSTAAEGGLAGRWMAGLMTVATRGQRAEDRKRPRLEPRLGRAGRHGEGWVAGAPARVHGALRPAGRRARRLRPGNGVAGLGVWLRARHQPAGHHPQPAADRASAAGRRDRQCGRPWRAWPGPASRPASRPARGQAPVPAAGRRVRRLGVSVVPDQAGTRAGRATGHPQVRRAPR